LYCIFKKNHMKFELILKRKMVKQCIICDTWKARSKKLSQVFLLFSTLFLNITIWVSSYCMHYWWPYNTLAIKMQQVSWFFNVICWKNTVGSLTTLHVYLSMLICTWCLGTLSSKLFERVKGAAPDTSWPRNWSATV